MDNYGDIGVAYRLARSLSSREDAPAIRLIVDDLRAFAALAPGIRVDLPIQEYRGWKVVSWEQGTGTASIPVEEEYRLRPPRVVIESLACGRPDWLETLLFGGSAPALIVNLEHLTAERFASEVHCMPSLTRSPLVRKAMFFPGFREDTGGLILDQEFLRSLDRREAEGPRDFRSALLGELAPNGSGEAEASEEAFWIPVFSYERNYRRIIADLAEFSRMRIREGKGPVLALSAAGKSQDPFTAAWLEAASPFPLLRLPFLPQEAWDRILIAADFSIIRGEDSLSRACLAGGPFLWQAYPQEGRHQMVKVDALLERLSDFLPRGGASAALESLFRSYNDRDADGADICGEDPLLPVLLAQESLLPGFRGFSASLRGHGDLGAHLLTFLRDLV